MAQISYVQQHQLTPEHARAAAQKVADRMAREFDLACVWEGDVLRFARSGVEGALTLQKQQAALNITLGFMMSMFAAKIESKVAENMRKVFAAPL